MGVGVGPVGAGVVDVPGHWILSGHSKSVMAHAWLIKDRVTMNTRRGREKTGRDFISLLNTCKSTMFSVSFEAGH
jgi:hypothetical protein